MKKSNQVDFRVPYNPWVILLTFITVDIFLTFFRWPLTVELFILLAGLIFPFFIFLYSAPAPYENEKACFMLEPLSPSLLQFRYWIPILIFASVLRFWKIGNPEWWLGGDDSLMAYGAIDLIQHWRWMPFVTLGQDPSTLSYLCYFALHATSSALLGFQLPPAIISWTTLMLSYPAARQYFSRSFSWILVGILGFNYWALLIARPLLPGITLPLWEIASLYILGRLLNSKELGDTRIWFCCLGFILGLGPYTFFAWPVLWLPVMWAAIAAWRKRKEKDHKSLFGFIFFLLLAISPFLAAVREESYGGYLLDASALSSFDWLTQIKITADYISSLFWGITSKGLNFQSGGFLNPILASCFFVGAVEILRFKKDPLCRFLALSFFIFLLPGALSHDFESHRILLLLPIVLTISAVGLQTLLLHTPPRKRIILLTCFFFLSGGIDLLRLFPRVFPTSSYSASSTDEQRIGYEVLKDLTLQRGSGFIFTDMTPNPMNFGLSYSTNSLNAIFDAKMPPERVNWAAVFTEDQYTLFLKRQFPSSHWVNLPTGLSGISSRHTLGLLTVNPQTLPRLLLWKKYFLWNQKINLLILNNPSCKSREKILAQILQFYPEVSDDNFLQSCFFEKLLFNYSWEKTFHPEDVGTNWGRFSATLRQSFQKSFQEPNLCEKYGRLLAMEGEDQEARKVFGQALKYLPGNEWLLSQMRQLDPAAR